MKITLLALNARYIHLSPAPFYLASELLEAGHSVTVGDHSVNESEEDVLADIVATSPELVGLSVYIWNVTYIKRLVPRIKQALPRTHILLGGPEVSYNAKEILNLLPEVDAVLSGEGELPIRHYADALSGLLPFDRVEGLSYRMGDKIVEGIPYIGTGTPKSPLNAGYAEALKGRIAYIESSRGCPFSCAFCLSGRCGGVRFFDREQVMRDILILSQSSRTVKFVDRTFNADPVRAAELLTFLLDHYGKEIPYGTRFHFELSGDLIDEAQLALLQNAPIGAFQVEIGVQSFHAPTLRAIHRGTNTQRLTHAIKRLLCGGNIHVHIDLIAGLPLESLADFEVSFNKAYALAPHMLQLGFLKLLHGAPMREEKEKYPCTFSALPPYEVESTPALSSEELAYIHTVELGCDRVYNSGRYRRTLALWQEEREHSSAFRLFGALGEALATLKKGYTLNDEISLLYAFFLKQDLAADRLRDAMLLDFIAGNSSRLIPSALRTEDPLYGRVKSALSRLYPEQKGIRRAVILLQSSRQAAFADYTQKHPITGEYPLCLVDISTLLTEKQHK